MAVVVVTACAEEARAVFLELCPEGFEELEREGQVELAAYVDVPREHVLRSRFATARATDVPHGWEDAWRTFHRPLRVGPLWLGPPWSRPDAGTLAVVIDPGQAFGTGAHATTRLCLELLLDLPRTSVADLGCGSGVLAIAATRLGFGPVVAIDCDEAAIRASRANARRNSLDVELRRADIMADPLPAAELALANLEVGLVERLAARVPARTLVASGYPATQRPRLTGWQRRARREADGWAAELFVRA